MDRKSIIVVLICLVLLAVFHKVVDKMYPPRPLPPGATNSLATAQSPAGIDAPATGATPTATSAAAPAAPADRTAVLAGGSQLVINTNIPEETIVVSRDDARYTFSSHGGGLKLIELLRYPEAVATRRGQAPVNRVAMLNDHSPVPTLAVWSGIPQDDGIFRLTRTANGVRAAKNLSSGLTLVKDFTIASNYLITATVRMENNSTQAMSLPPQEWVVGIAAPMNLRDTGETVGLMWNNGSKNQEVGSGWFANRTLGCFPGTPRSEYRAGQSNVVWAAAHNQFFTLVLAPAEPAQAVVARSIALPPPSAEDLRENPRANRLPKGFVTTVEYPGVTLQPAESAQREFILYAGPKEYRTLARIASELNNTIDAVMGFNGFFGFFSKALLLGMNGLHNALNLPYGWTIIAITVFVKILFWPLTAISTRSMKRMQALQPQMKAIADKYKDDPVKRNQKTMEFMRENKVNPMGGCLPMLLQMPVFIGFFYMIRSAIELRGASFLWVADLSRPDTLFILPGIDFPFNLMPFLMGATMLWQAHLTPMSPGMDPMQQKIMRYMPLMFMVFLYNFSAGLTLYWTVQNLLTIAQTKLTKTKAAAPAPAPALTPGPKKRK